MGVSISSSATQVTISGGVSIASQTMLKATTGAAVQNATSTIFTVTAGKTAYLSSISVSMTGGAAGGMIILKNDGVEFWRGMVGGISMPSHVFIAYPAGREITFAATKVMAVTADATTACTVSVTYYEV